MIGTEQFATVARPVDEVWQYVRDIARWAEIMPGYQSCDLIDADNSCWTLKVGVGGLVRTVRVGVRVDEWAGPGLVRFSFRLAGDPVQGSGSYRAEALDAGATRIALAVEVEGSGPMAPMWEAMGRPLLPQFAASFAERLRDAIEQAPRASPEGWLARLWRSVRSLFSRT